ncbi:MAG: hypothetical protein AAF654_14550 [Myxococcota bacterium]
MVGSATAARRELHGSPATQSGPESVVSQLKDAGPGPKDVARVLRSATAERFSSLKLRFQAPVSGELNVPITTEGSVVLFFPRNSSVTVDLALVPGPEGARLEHLKIVLKSGQRGREVQVREFSALLKRFKGLARLISSTTQNSLRQVEVNRDGQVKLAGTHWSPSLLPFGSQRFELGSFSSALPRVPVDLAPLMEGRGAPSWAATPEFNLGRIIAAFAGLGGTFTVNLEGTTGDTQAQLDGFGIHARHVPVTVGAKGEFRFDGSELRSEMMGTVNLGAHASANAAIRATVTDHKISAGGHAALSTAGLAFGQGDQIPEHGNLQLRADRESVSQAVDSMIRETRQKKSHTKWWARALMTVADLLRPADLSTELDGTISGKGEAHFETEIDAKLDATGRAEFSGRGKLNASTRAGTVKSSIASDVSVAGKVSGKASSDLSTTQIESDGIAVKGSNVVSVGPLRFNVSSDQNVEVDGKLSVTQR